MCSIVVYIHMQKLAKQVPHLQDEILHWVFLRGLRPRIKASIIAQKGDIKSVADILEFAISRNEKFNTQSCVLILLCYGASLTVKAAL